MAETFLYLTTIGHKSGNRHTIEIWYVEYDGAYYMVSEGRENAHWVQNILKNPQVQFSVGTPDDKEALVKYHHAIGRIITADHAPDIFRAVSAKMDAKYGWSDGLIIEVK
ncbi:MAG: hypothetical protein CUN52_06650 [Phototrophicales bacterium]|nr:MAG: hypothetical protein CUN52_06650 [Phototrophicales bacterium]